MRERSGFTLIELLTVIAIISLLLAILLPSYAEAKRAAARANCSQQLHAVGVAFGQYISAYRAYPPYGSSQTSRNSNYFLADKPGMEDWTALYVTGQLTNIEVLFCPATSAKAHQFDTPQNQWSSGKMRTGYSRRFLPTGPDGLTGVHGVGPGQALAADLMVSPGWLKYQHLTGANVLLASGAVFFRDDTASLFTAAGASGSAKASNEQLDAVWAALDR